MAYSNQRNLSFFHEASLRWLIKSLCLAAFLYTKIHFGTWNFPLTRAPSDPDSNISPWKVFLILNLDSPRSFQDYTLWHVHLYEHASSSVSRSQRARYPLHLACSFNTVPALSQAEDLNSWTVWARPLVSIHLIIKPQRVQFGTEYNMELNHCVYPENISWSPPH